MSAKYKSGNLKYVFICSPKPVTKPISISSPASSGRPIAATNGVTVTAPSDKSSVLMKPLQNSLPSSPQTSKRPISAQLKSPVPINNLPDRKSGSFVLEQVLPAKRLSIDESPSTPTLPPVSPRGSLVANAGSKIERARSPSFDTGSAQGLLLRPEPPKTASPAALAAASPKSTPVYRPGSISAVDSQLEKKSPNILASLFHIAKLIGNASNADALLEVLKRETCSLVQASICRVTLVTTDSLIPTDTRIAYPLGTGLVGESQQTASILHIEHPSSDVRYVMGLDTQVLENAANVCKHLLCVPIQAQSVGLVAILTAEREVEFTDDQGAALYSLGEFIAGNLKAVTTLEQTASLYAASKSANVRVEIMLEIAKALMSEHRLSVLVSFIISEVPELLDCDRCTLFFVDRRTNELIVTRGASHGRRAPQLVTTTSVTSAGSVNSSNSDDKDLDEDSNGALPFRQGAGEIRFPMGRGIAGHVAVTGQTVNILNAYADDRFNPEMDKQSGYKTRNILCVPMSDSHGDIIGVIQCLNKNDKLGPFDSSDENVLRMFSAQAAIAVKNSRLFAEAQRALKKSDALLEVTHAISQELVLAPLINIIVTKIQQLLTAERCTVFLVDEDSQTMWSTASMSHGMGSTLPIDNNVEAVVRFPLDRGIVGHVAKTGTIVNLVDAYNDERFNRSFDKETGFRTKALLSVPIINSKQKTIGVTQVLNKKNGGAFSEEDVKLLQAFSAQAAVAIGNSKLYHDTKKALNSALREQRNLKFMLEFTRNLCTEMQTSSIVQQLHFQVTDLTKAEFVQIFLIDTETGKFYNVVDDDANHNSRHHFDPNTGLVGQSIRSSAPILIPRGAYNTPGFNVDVDGRANHKTESILIVPIIYDPLRDPAVKKEEEKPENLKSKMIGIISAIHDTKDSQNTPFTVDDQRVLVSLSLQAANSLVKSEQLKRLVDDANKESAAHNDNVVENLKSDPAMFDLASDNIESFQFKMNDFQIIENIGSGSYGEVFAAKLRGKIVAVKKLNTRALKSDQVDAFCSEASLMCQLKHPNVVQFIGAVTQPPDLCIVTEYCARGSLCDLLLDPQVKIDFSKKMKIILDSAAGMAYLHDSNPVILHRDLKSDNLLVTNDWQIKVADFGLSRFRSDKKVMTQVGTPMWMAPEVILGEKYTERADVYSFGIIIWEIMTRLEPYEDKEAMQIVVEVVNNGLRPHLPAEFADCPLVPLMKDCWNQDPAKRPTFKVTIERLLKIAEQTAGTKKWS